MFPYKNTVAVWETDPKKIEESRCKMNEDAVSMAKALSKLELIKIKLERHFNEGEPANEQSVLNEIQEIIES